MSKFQQTSITIHDVHTELIVQPFADRTLVLVTQMGKVGYLIQASIPSTTDLHALHVSDPRDSLPCPPPAIQLTPIFGSAPSVYMQTLYSLYAAQIATLVWLSTRGEPRSVVVGLAFKRLREGDYDEEQQQTFHKVMRALQEILGCE